MNKKEYNKNYRELNREEIKEYKQEWYISNKAKIKKRAKEYYEKNKEEIKERNRLYRLEVNDSDMNYKIKHNVFRNIKNGIKNKFFSPTLERTLCYTSSDITKKLESLFDEEMKWENFGSRFIHTKNWHIHHIIPMKVYNFYNESEIRKCWDLDNIIPKWNKERSDEIDWGKIKEMSLERLLPDTLLVDDVAGNRNEI